MAEINYREIFKRPADEWILKKNVLKGKKLIELLYIDILLFKESSVYDTYEFKSISILDKTLKEVKFVYSNTQKSNINIDSYFKKKSTNKHSPWIIKNVINPLDLKNEIYFTSSDNNTKMLIKHIRNAFTHNLIYEDGEYVVFGDFLPKGGKIDFDSPTMLGRLKYEIFVKLVSSFKTMIK